MRRTVKVPCQCRSYILRLFIEYWLEVLGEETTMGIDQVRNMRQEVFWLVIQSVRISVQKQRTVPCQAYLSAYRR